MAERPTELTADAALIDGPPIGDFIALLKPRVMSLVVFTAIAGLVLAPGTLHPVLAAIAVLCIAVGARAPPGRSTCGTSATSTPRWRGPEAARFPPGA